MELTWIETNNLPILLKKNAENCWKVSFDTFFRRQILPLYYMPYSVCLVMHCECWTVIIYTGDVKRVEIILITGKLLQCVVIPITTQLLNMKCHAGPPITFLTGYFGICSFFNYLFISLFFKLYYYLLYFKLYTQWFFLHRKSLEKQQYHSAEDMLFYQDRTTCVLIYEHWVIQCQRRMFTRLLGYDL